MAAPIVTQPGVHSDCSAEIGEHQNVCAPNCLPDLNFLNAIDELLVCQSADSIEVCTPCQKPNKYMIKNALGEDMYTAQEDSTYRKWFGCFVLQRFNLKIFDKSKKMILNFTYPLRCQPCCFQKCLAELKVSDSTGDIIGHIVEDSSCPSPKISIKNNNGQTILKIVGPCWSLLVPKCCRAVMFKIFNTDGKQIGHINKQRCVVMQAFTNADNYDITFPLDLDVHMKATLLGALFLIDYMYFEGPPLDLLGTCCLCSDIVTTFEE